MQIKAIAAVILAYIFIVACEKEEVFIATEESDKLTGYWVNQQITDTLFSYDKSENMLPKEYGFAFLGGGKFIERKNSGFCGTPPIAYADYTGNWSLNDSIINITAGYWGGTVTYRWQVISADHERLIINTISEQYSREN